MAESKFFRYIFVLILTAARIPFAVAFACVILLSESTPEKIQHLILISVPFAETCIALLVLGELTDFFDGMLARKLGVVSEAGAMLDPYADSISRIIIYWALAGVGLVMPVVPIVMACRDITVAYSRVILGKAGKSVSAKWSGKIKAVVQGYGCVLLFLQPYLWNWNILGKWFIQVGSWIIIVVTVASMLEYIRAAVKEMGHLTKTPA